MKFLPEKMLLFTLAITATMNFAAVNQQHTDPAVQQLVLSIEGITNAERQELTTELNKLFQPVFNRETPDYEILENVKGIISALIFEGSPMSVVADLAFKSYEAERNGAPDSYVRDLAIVGISTPITAVQLEEAAKSIEKLMNAQIDPLIIEEFVSYGIYNNWSGETISIASNGLISAASQKIPPKKAALTFIISIDQQINEKPAAQIIEDAIKFLIQSDTSKTDKANREKIARSEMEKAIQQGIPMAIANEIYFQAMENNWSEELISAVFDGIISGATEGLSPEKLATSILIRIDTESGKISPEKLVKEEIRFVKKLEKNQSQLYRKDTKKYKRKPPPPKLSQQPYLQPAGQSNQTPKYFNATARKSINRQLMWQTMLEFLGPPPTPYRWGGTSKAGIDCSGLVMQIYRTQGIYLPRVSRDQFKIGRPVYDQLQFGDLVFFSKYGAGYPVTHVGIYIGSNKFIHASASRGVTISSLNKRYYRLRFSGARRIL